jgi:hypothetical protein
MPRKNAQGKCEQQHPSLFTRRRYDLLIILRRYSNQYVIGTACYEYSTAHCVYNLKMYCQSTQGLCDAISRRVVPLFYNYHLAKGQALEVIINMVTCQPVVRRMQS